MEPLGTKLALITFVDYAFKTAKAAYSISHTSYQWQILDACELLASEERRLRSTFDMILYNTFPPDEVQQLLQDGQIPRWESLEVDAAFRNTLGVSGSNEFAQRLQNSVDALSALEESISRITPTTIDITPDSRRSLNLRRQLRWVLGRRKFEREMKELRQRNLSLDTYVAISASNRSVQARQNLDDALRVVSGVEAIARQAAEAISPNRNDNASLAGNEDAMSVMTDVSLPHEPEQSAEGAKLRYLHVTIQPDKNESTSQSPAAPLQEQALLDSGATHCMISVTLAHKLGLEMPDEPDLREVRTLIPDDNPPKCWQAKVNLRWKDSNQKRRGTKVDVHVVFVTNLGKDLVLSQEFMNNHEEVWHAATQVPESDMQLNSTFLGWLRPDDKKKQAELLAEREKKNQARYEAESSKRQETGSKLEASDASEAGPSTESEPGPSSTSLGSSQDKR